MDNDEAAGRIHCVNLSADRQGKASIRSFPPLRHPLATFYTTDYPSTTTSRLYHILPISLPSNS